MSVIAPVVPAEFVGLARQFRARVEAGDDDTSALIDAIALPLARRRARHPTPRREHLAGAVRRWRQDLAGICRLALTIEHHGTCLALVEIRASASRYGRTNWGTSEPGVALLRLEWRVRPGDFHIDNISLAAVSLHGLGRRLQKGWDVTDAAILDDLLALAVQAPTLTQQPIGTEFSVLCRDGVWAGHVSEVTGTRGGKSSILNARTYLSGAETAR